MKTRSPLPGISSENIISNVFVVPMEGGIAVIDSLPGDGHSIHVRFFEGSGSSCGTCVPTHKAAARKAKEFNKNFLKARVKRIDVRGLMQRLVEMS